MKYGVADGDRLRHRRERGVKMASSVVKIFVETMAVAFFAVEKLALVSDATLSERCGADCMGCGMVPDHVAKVGPCNEPTCSRTLAAQFVPSQNYKRNGCVLGAAVTVLRMENRSCLLEPFRGLNDVSALARARIELAKLRLKHQRH